MPLGNSPTTAVSQSLAQAPRCGLLLLQTALAPEANRALLLVQLTLAYVVSLRIRVHLPIRDAEFEIVESAFDELLAKFELNSKGIAYLRNRDAGEISKLVEASALIICDSAEYCALAFESRRPLVYVDCQDGKLSINPQNLDIIGDTQLQDELQQCVELLSTEADGVVSRADSLQWW